MKRVFVLMAIAAMVLNACEKKPADDPGNKTGDDPEEYVQPIEIDGNFDDWAKLDASKVFTAKCADGAAKDALKLVKVYADETFVFVYIEWDKEQIECDPDPENGDFVPFHIYFDGDGKADTGGFGDQWSDACVDVCYEGFLTDGTNIASYDPGAYNWIGEVNGSGWDWCDPALVADGSGLCQGAGVFGKYELLITRELYPLGKLADTFGIGFDIQQHWDSVGILPNAEVTEDNPGGLCPMLKVTTVK